MKMILSASNLDISGWIRGILSAGISSFSGAIASGFGPMMVDPQDFNIQHPAKAIETAAIGALIAGAVSIAKFLQTQPLPELRQVSTTVQTVQSATPETPKVITTIQESHVEPMPPPPPAA